MRKPSTFTQKTSHSGSKERNRDAQPYHAKKRPVFKAPNNRGGKPSRTEKVLLPLVPTFPMRLNKYLAWKKFSTRKASDEIIKKGQVFINNRKAEVGMMVSEKDIVEVKFRGKQTPPLYFVYNKPKGVLLQEQGNEVSTNTSKKFAGKKGDKNKISYSFPKGTFPIGSLEKDVHGLMILTNDGRITERLLSSAFPDEKEYVVATKNSLRESFRTKMEAGPTIEGEKTKHCKVTVLNEHTFVVVITEEIRHQVRRMCTALFQEVADIERVRVLNIRLGELRPGAHRPIVGAELQNFLGTLLS